jgi:hypothetical protein
MDNNKDVSDQINLINKKIDNNKKHINKRINLNKMLELKKKKIIIKNCFKINKDHKWITVREKGPYGEKFTFCKFCKIKLNEKTFYE